MAKLNEIYYYNNLISYFQSHKNAQIDDFTTYLIF